MVTRLTLCSMLLAVSACSGGSASSSTTAVASPTTVAAGAPASATTTFANTTTAPTTTAPTTTMAPPTSTTEGDLPTQLVVVFEGGEVRTPLRQEVALGDPVAISVTSDIADEVHLHTYDLMVDVAAGETVTLEFSATIPGIFEMELESAHLQVLELVVQ